MCCSGATSGVAQVGAVTAGSAIAASATEMAVVGVSKDEVSCITVCLTRTCPSY